MCRNLNGKRYNSHSFKYAREAWAINMAQLNKGRKFSKESRLKMSESAKGKTPWNKGLILEKKPTEAQVRYNNNPALCESCNLPIPFLARNRNRYCSVECRNANGLDWRSTWHQKANSGSFKPGNVISEVTASRISKALTGLKRPTGECHHCGKTGAISLLKRWHFDNCKWKTK